MKFKNTHTRNKVYHNNKIKKKIAELWIKLQTKLPWNKSNIQLELLTEKPFENFWKGQLRPPSGFKSKDLKRVLYSDIVFIEQFEELKKGLHKLHEKEKPVPYSYFRQVDIDSFFEHVLTYPNGKIERKMLSFIPKTKELLYYFESLHIYISSITNGSITVSINTVISQEFQLKLNHLYKNEVDDGHFVLAPPYRLNEFFNLSKWALINYSEIEYKKSNIEDFFLEMKFLLMSYLSKELPLYFSRKYEMVPSINFFETEFKYYPISSSLFFESIDIKPDDPFKHYNTVGNIEIYEGRVDESLKNENINIIYNNIKQFPNNESNPLKPEFLSNVLYKNLSHLMSLEYLLRNFSRESALLIKEFNESNEAKFESKNKKYKKLTKKKIVVDQILFKLKELNRDIDENIISNLYESYLNAIQLDVRDDNQHNIIKLKYTILTEKVASNLSRVEYLKRAIDDSLELLRNDINKSHQMNMLLIGSTTLIVTLITLLKASN